jgi:hypothetical protein
MGETKVDSIVVRSALLPMEKERQDNIIYTAQGGLSEPQLVDSAIEDPKVRENLAPNAGKISITVMAGEELGQVSINVQFEGKRGRYDFCLQNQGELFEAASGWLGELLAELGGDFDVRIEAKPCPHTEERLPLRRAANILERQVPDIREEIEHTPAVARTAAVAHKIGPKSG